MLPHSFKDLPHASDNAVVFNKLQPHLLTANTLFIKIHGMYYTLFDFEILQYVSTYFDKPQP